MLSSRQSMLVFLRVLISLCMISCRTDPELTACLEDEKNGTFRFNRDQACGCGRVQCEKGTQCYQGQCCDPQVQDCGCRQSCEAGESCFNGTCCNSMDPLVASKDSSCGCGAVCDPSKGTFCTAKDDASGYECTCDPTKATDEKNCGCKQRCIAGELCRRDTQDAPLECGCDFTSQINLQNDRNCGCNGPCPDGAHCAGGVCACNSANQAICNGKCVPSESCSCDPSNPPSWAQTSVDNCGCKRPCGAGEKCENGRCVCNSLAHSSDNHWCGCQLNAENKPLDCIKDKGAGYVCSGGQCICDSVNLSNSSNCACIRKCDTTKGETCQRGACVCDPSAHLSDYGNCGCSRPCDPNKDEDVCLRGVCQCDPSFHQSDDKNCNCGSACDTPHGFACQRGVCACDPSHQNDYNNCGCTGYCNKTKGYLCQGGTCFCDPNHENDPNNCGCKRACRVGSGEHCSGGACLCGGRVCPTGQGCTLDDGGTPICVHACRVESDGTPVVCGAGVMCCPSGKCCKTGMPGCCL